MFVCRNAVRLTGQGNWIIPQNFMVNNFLGFYYSISGSPLRILRVSTLGMKQVWNIHMYVK